MRTAIELLQEEERTEVGDEDEGQIQSLRSKATELLLREEYGHSIQVYSQIISLCGEILLNKNPDAARSTKIRQTLCLAFSNRAEAQARLLELTAALQDCEEALKIDKFHFKTLLCKGKILLSLNRYSLAMECFKAANLEASENLDSVNVLLNKCKKLESLSRTGAFDVSDWVVSGFQGRAPELGEFIGPVEIKKSRISGRGLFATKNVESGGLLLVTKAIAVDRAIMPQESGENAQLVIWKNLIEKVMESAKKCDMIRNWIMHLSAGEDCEERMEVPEIGYFAPDAGAMSTNISNEELDAERIVSILDVNSILESTSSAKVLGKNANYQGVGLWILASFINHSCDPNIRRVHVGDYAVVHASRDVKAGEELTFAYFNVLCTITTRQEMAKNWGFKCKCRRCKTEENLSCKQEMMDIVTATDMGNKVYRLEEGMRKWMVRGKGKGHLRASFWEAYSKLYRSEKMMRKWGRKVPSLSTVVDSVVDVIGSDERILHVFMEGLKRGGIVNGVMEIEKATKYERGIYSKVMKRQAMKTLFHFSGNQERQITLP